MLQLDIIFLWQQPRSQAGARGGLAPPEKLQAPPKNFPSPREKNQDSKICMPLYSIITKFLNNLLQFSPVYDRNLMLLAVCRAFTDPFMFIQVTSEVT